MNARFVIFLMLFVSKTVVSYSQYIPIQGGVSTPHGNVPTTYYVPVPHIYHNTSNNKQGRISSSKYEFKVVLKNDSTFLVKTRIKLVEKADHSITVNDEKVQRTYYPADTKSISRIATEGRTLVGIPADSCWLFKCAAGKINSYSTVAEYGIRYATAIQEGDNGRIVPLTKENLEYIVGTEDIEIYKLVEMQRLIEAIEMYNKR